MKLDGKVSLITGGDGGIGAATALELARLGSDIMIVDWRIDGRARGSPSALSAVTSIAPTDVRFAKARALWENSDISVGARQGGALPSRPEFFKD
jgi:NAD(P)-dependent dehydrogenase (short-subunit alcohol dehydrogenase family)